MKFRYTYFLPEENLPAISFGALDFNASPRPDSDGLVMK
jgi:hypothetical protein